MLPPIRDEADKRRLPDRSTATGALSYNSRCVITLGWDAKAKGIEGGVLITYHSINCFPESLTAMKEAAAPVTIGFNGRTADIHQPCVRVQALLIGHAAASQGGHESRDLPRVLSVSHNASAFERYGRRILLIGPEAFAIYIVNWLLGRFSLNGLVVTRIVLGLSAAVAAETRKGE
jgi:hypothetical protein